MTSDSTVALEAADTGTGIAPEDTTRIFDRFFRADPARARNGGRGLGLAIAKWIADNHDSTIQVTSTMGRGSTFTVRFPRYDFEWNKPTSPNLEDANLSRRRNHASEESEG
jgi:signal transduction histidine kinase